MEAKPLRVYMEKRGLADDPFLCRTLEYIEGHPLFEHRFFKAFSAGKLSLEQVKEWAKQRLFSSQRRPCREVLSAQIPESANPLPIWKRV